MDDFNQAASIIGRLRLALRVFFDSAFAARLNRKEVSFPEKGTPTAALPTQGSETSALLLLSALQRDGRFLDFLQEDITAFSDADIGAATRVVHSGCKKTLDRCFSLEPIYKEPDGASIRLQPDYDPKTVLVIGEVPVGGATNGYLRHHGWKVTEARLPVAGPNHDARILLPAEIELC